MSIPLFLARLLGWLRPVTRPDDLPAVILREFDGAGRHFTESLSSGRHRRPFSFRMHPISELTEYRDRLFLATFPQIGDRVR
ncbi:hypothetical protein [Niveispirillum sp. BGYR6]|uniref:hypothetical protein n=1 Tax=Niveispirillum sp. BGYR6 TaxID=2971249 RepID=UPI0022B97003|nr:hypothetical protein [Niveispirillum sp. BGYR6]MDG5495991.1 hypothetical protein [Niveispirillum sp. BGYR6]